MIDRGEAEVIAREWARQESTRRNYECTPMLSEFDLGYLVWTRQPSSVLPMPGDGTSVVIDRETGQMSVWPVLPPLVVQEAYRSRRHRLVASVRTADPAVDLRRDARHRPTPTVVAHLSLDGRPFQARGAKGDRVLRHHRLVRDYLSDLPEGHLVRGADRHAELIVLSDALYALDRERQDRGVPPVTEHEARQLLRDARFEALYVREPGDPLGARPAPPCESCLMALAYFGLLPATCLSGVALREGAPVIPLPGAAATDGSRPDGTGRHDTGGEGAGGNDTGTGGDDTGRDRDGTGRDGNGGHGTPALLAHHDGPATEDGAAVGRDGAAAVDRVLAVPGQRHIPFPAAEQALARLDGLTCARRGPGRTHWIRAFGIDPAAAVHSTAPLADLAAATGARLFPLGSEGDGDTVLAIDERGRVFALDQAGEWFLGDTVDAALATLVTGGPAARVRDDGTWD